MSQGVSGDGPPAGAGLPDDVEEAIDRYGRASRRRVFALRESPEAYNVALDDSVTAEAVLRSVIACRLHSAPAEQEIVRQRWAKQMADYLEERLLTAGPVLLYRATVEAIVADLRTTSVAGRRAGGEE